MLLLIVAVIAIATLTIMFNLFKKPSSVVEIRDFSCQLPSPSTVRFTFKYPIFKNLENVTSDQENCALRIKNGENYTLVNIRARSGKGILFALSSSIKKNSRGIPYILDYKNEEVRFMSGDKPGTGDVSIKINKLPILQKNQDNLGFDSKQFLKNVAESFAFINKSNEVIEKSEDVEKQNVKFGEIISFKENEKLQFSDFSIQFLGTTNQKVDSNPNLNFVYYNFIIKDSDGRKRNLNWSSGTGDIGPAIFVVKNKVYQLELKYSEKDNKWLKDNELVISESNIEISKYLFQTIARLSFFQKYTLSGLENALGITFTKTENSNQYFDIFESDGFSPFSHAEVRINKSDAAKKLLILNTDQNIAVTKQIILTHYPSAQLSVHQPNDPIRSSLVVTDSDEKISFGFDKNEVLTSIVFDTTE